MTKKYAVFVLSGVVSVVYLRLLQVFDIRICTSLKEERKFIIKTPVSSLLNYLYIRTQVTVTTEKIHGSN